MRTTNRIARAWVAKVAVPFVCPICGRNVGGDTRPPSHEWIPLLVQKTSAGHTREVMLHNGCQAACTPAELREITLKGGR